MTTPVERTGPPFPDLALWFSFLGGPAAWTTHLLSSYPLVPVACDMGSTAILNIITVATALLSVTAALVGWVGYRRLRTHGAAGAGNAAGRARFMAISGILMGLFFAYAILVEGLPPVLQDPCEIGT